MTTTQKKKKGSKAASFRAFILPQIDQTASHLQNARPDQIRHPLTLLRIQARMNLAQRSRDRSLQPLPGLDSSLRTRRRLARIKTLAGKRVRKIRQRSPIIHCRLRTLGLQLIQDASQLHDLFLLQPQLMSEETQRPANAKPAKIFLSMSVTAVMPVAHEIFLPAKMAGFTL
jgi:hypothetical protein